MLSASAHDCQRAAKETGKNTYQMHLASKETEEDHPSEEEPLRTRRNETRRRITAKDRPN